VHIFSLGKVFRTAGRKTRDGPDVVAVVFTGNQGLAMVKSALTQAPVAGAAGGRHQTDVRSHSLGNVCSQGSLLLGSVQSQKNWLLVVLLN
jgi:hypothetical protein